MKVDEGENDGTVNQPCAIAMAYSADRSKSTASSLNYGDNHISFHSKEPAEI